MGREDCREGNLSRPGTFLAGALRESQGVTLGVPDAPGACPVDHSCLGAAIPDGAIALGRLLSATRPCPPNAVGPCTARRVAGATLAARKGAGRRG
jgi:hypothetical protein